MEPYEVEEAVGVDQEETAGIPVGVDPGPTDDELAELEALDAPPDDRPLTIDEWLDREDLDRLEWERVEQDLYPGAVHDASQVAHIHRDTDPVQSWMADMRRL